MTMMISIPDRVLLIKVTKLLGGSQVVGACLVFYDLTDITTQVEKPIAGELGKPSNRPRQLIKLPVLLHNRVLLLSLDEVVWAQEEPQNMGAWSFVAPQLEWVLDRVQMKTKRAAYAGRHASASTATGQASKHLAEQKALVEQALTV